MNNADKNYIYNLIYTKMIHGKTKKIIGLKLIFISLCVSIYITFLLITLITDNNHNIYNIEGLIIFLFSLIIVIWAIESINKNGVKAYNLFFGIFFLFLMINTFNISGLQQPKTILDIYYYFFGPLIFGYFLYLGEKGFFLSKKNVIFIRFINPNFMAVAILILYYIVNIVIILKVGVAYFDMINNKGTNFKTDYYVSIISSLNDILYIILLIFVPHINKFNKVIIIGSVFIFSGIFTVSRNIVMQVSIFIMLYFLLYKGKSLFSRKNLRKIILILIVIFILFGALGQIRQANNSNLIINDILDSKINNAYVSWLFSYTSINFDVLKLKIEQEPTYIFNATLTPIYRLFNEQQKIQDYFDRNGNLSLNGFNASTFLGAYVDDLGIFYFIEIIFVGIFLALMINISKIYRLTGIYIFLLTLISLSIFGNFFMLYGMIVSMFFALILLLFCKSKKVVLPTIK